MAVYRLVVAYDGSGYRGYAKQDGHRTIQGELDLAISTVLGTSISTAVAGRTDAGVHAHGQVVSFEFEGDVDERRLLRSLNGMVGPEIAVKGIAVAAEGFNARFSAKWRRYRYQIDQRATPDPLTRHSVWHVGKALDVGAMETIATAYMGQHDFTSFCKTVEGKSNVRRVDESVLIQGDDVLEYWIQANAFCHQMVRSLVGFMYDVGRGYSDGKTVESVIASKDRSSVASVAPPHGLTLWGVGY